MAVSRTPATKRTTVTGQQPRTQYTPSGGIDYAATYGIQPYNPNQQDRTTSPAADPNQGVPPPAVPPPAVEEPEPPFSLPPGAVWTDPEKPWTTGWAYTLPEAPPPPQGPTVPAQAPAGWDQEKWANPEHNTLKYQIGRILASYGDLSQEQNRMAAIAAIQEAFPGTQFDGKDRIFIPGEGEGFNSWIDIFQGASAGQYIPQWLDLDAIARDEAAAAAAGGSGIDLTGLLGGGPSSVTGGIAAPNFQGGSAGGGSSSTKPFMGDQIRDVIMQLLDTGGAFNQNLVDMRSESLREELESARRSELSTLDAVLADRGLMTGGAATDAHARLSERLGTAYGTRLRDLIADEARAADQRLIQALVTGAGMTISEAQQAIDWFQAQTGRIGTEGSLANDAARIALQDKLGVGQLGLGQAQLEANYGLGQGRLALDQQLGMLGLQNDWMRILVQLLGAQAAQNT